MTDALSLFVISFIDVLGAQVINQGRKKAHNPFETPKSCQSRWFWRSDVEEVGSSWSHSIAMGEFTPTTQEGEVS